MTQRYEYPKLLPPMAGPLPGIRKDALREADLAWNKTCGGT